MGNSMKDTRICPCSLPQSPPPCTSLAVGRLLRRVYGISSRSYRIPMWLHLRIEGNFLEKRLNLTGQFVRRIVATHETFFEFLRLY